ncbi:MAG: VOC family protein [Lachnospiraceae bacterium]|nr:VOC family protein [Lachnospiraceae bacterium]
MRYGSIYLVVKDFEKSLDFYEKVLDMKVSAVNGTRFAMFNNDGLNICLMNGYYDINNRDKVINKGERYPDYDNVNLIAESDNSRKVFINLGVPNLREEYERIKELNIAADLTPIRYIEVFSPYWYFTFKDPDGNPIEITGGYSEP